MPNPAPEPPKEVTLSLSDPDLFRREIRAFLDRELTDRMRGAPRTIMLLDVDIQQEWHRRLAAQGWAVPDWPLEHGGTGWSQEQMNIFFQEMVRAGAPPLSPNLQMIGPVLIAWGTPEQQQRHLPPLRSGEIVWCQGFSEPGAGSDLASLRLKAVRDGDDYVLNGQKIWTSYAHASDWMFALVRTSTEGKPQAGISFLLIDMATPGIVVRPIRSIDGLHHLNEVFFNDVRVPVGNRVGAENDGWSVAKYLLQHERNGVAGDVYLRMRLAKIRAIAEALPDDEGGGTIAADPVYARRFRKVEVELLALEALIASADAATDPEFKQQISSVLKLRGSEIEQAIAELGRIAMGSLAWLDQSHTLEHPDEPVVGPAGVPEAMLSYLLGRAASIYGGSSEIQRGIIFKQLRQYGV
ncbi:acyl-CoA dehydrogenase family protein [Sphingobium sp. CR2-8]|uniref:acyl-CoA dehydrogenase family protein n=1 Tax=Sphingobium sp. CR2-8 TaxID=1306534 RepID=UPI002DB9B274|nr:acyl-CoA dehydrogenase family protein [Sphingobium sp. CR2-8]MEC3911877.1 acyl-CoA dehydrogenase family protein [Sphingobium sp. CR2-8]